jgi:glycerol uptake facilitator-like aquaporin
MIFRFSKSIIIGVLLFGLLTATGFQSAYAIDKSRTSIWLLFFSGLGSSAAGAIIQGQANETYDRYLHTAVQTDMEKLIDDYDRKHQQSIIASRAGLGLVVGAILLSLVDAAYIPPEVQETPVLFGSELRSFSDQVVSMEAQNDEILVAIGRRF